MAGLNSAMEPQAAPEEQEPESNVTPEEQAMYEQVVNNALEIIYPKGEETIAPQIRESLSSSDKPVMNLAMASVAVVSGLVASAKQAGQPIAGEILFHAGAQIVELLAEAAETFKIAEYSEEDVERAFYMAADMYRTQAEQSGDLDVDTLKADYAELEQANQAGNLDQMMPGMVEKASSMPQREDLDQGGAEGEQQEEAVV